MAYNEALVERTNVWAALQGGIETKVMFGGYCYLVGGNMLGGVKDKLILRLGPSGDSLVGTKHITGFPEGKPMSGFQMVAIAGLPTEKSLHDYLDRALAFAKTLPPKAEKKKTATKATAKPKKKAAAAKPKAKAAKPKAKPKKR